ncbi:Macrolide export protein MacA [Planctomycetes bacterium Poly30]|uniref:Macrolide export protein MacA n=1 Tax=Saltatorellus ferox TaxID=2528018 RepID=A0A518EUY9_9BACT|nr:Macrolide export protein MacA [Planctomycetes bacterium Poly30]
MSLVDGNVDLAALSRGASGVEPPRRSWLRIVVPLVILGAFAWVLRDSLGELWRERPIVTVIRPVRLEGQPPFEGGRVPSTERRQLAVQAAGWVEPDPFPTLVPALAGGVVLEVLVQESDVVEVGDVVARLVADDARLAHAEAAARVEERRAALALAQVREAVAAESFDAAIGVTEAASTARADRAGREAEAKLREASLREGEARISLAESEVLVQRELDAAGASGARQVEIAEAELEVARAKRSTLEAQLELARSAALVARARDERAQADLRLRFEDRLARDESAAAVRLAAAELARAEAELATAALALDRTDVVASTAGVVLERIASDGETLAPGAAVASVFSPEKLRVRVDVPQGDIEKVRVGQTAEVLADARPGRPYRGEVIRIVERADIQKVTLEAQVRVLDADGILRPDMLTQVRFFTEGAKVSGQGSEGAASEPMGTRSVALRLALPARVLDGEAVWLFDPVTKEARRAAIQVGGRVQPSGVEGGDWREVLSGVNLTDKVIDGGRTALEKLSAAKGGADRVPVQIEEPRS